MPDNERTREDEWFLKNEQQLLEAARVAREKRERERAAEEREEESKRLKDLHFMKCPKCGHDLREEPVDEVLVDRCTFCEGVYLDAGELDKLFLQKAGERKGFLRKVLGV